MRHPWSQWSEMHGRHTWSRSRTQFGSTTCSHANYFGWFYWIEPHGSWCIWIWARPNLSGRCDTQYKKHPDALEAVWDIDIEEIAALHEVLEPPIRRQSFGLVFFLMEMRVDSRLTSRSDDVFGLVEVIIRGHQISGDSISKLLVTWLRRRARRIQLLSQLRLDGMCDNEDTFECKVYYNNILWPEADYALRQFQDGDLVWVEIHMNTMSARAAFSTLAEMENAERSRALGSVEDATWDPADWTGLISEDFGVGPSTNHGSSFDRLPPPGNPVEYFEISNGEDGKNETTVPRLDISDDEDEQQAKSMQRYRMKPPTDQHKILALFQPWSEGLLTLDFRIDDGFTPVGLQFLSACVIGWHEDVKEIHIYTDGSYDRRHDVSSFAFAVFGWNADIDDKHYFLGWSGSIVCTDTEGRNYLGAQTHSAGDGEVSALLWAILWILQSPIWCPHTLHFDSMVARFTALRWLAVWWGESTQEEIERGCADGGGCQTWYDTVQPCEGPQQPSMQQSDWWICPPNHCPWTQWEGCHTGLETSFKAGVSSVILGLVDCQRTQQWSQDGWRRVQLE